MNAEDFESFRLEIEKFQRDLLSAKGDEYAQKHGDRLKNFKDGALMEDRIPEEYLRSLQIKHILSVKKLIVDLASSGKPAPIEQWREKLMDINSYNILLLALIAERINNSSLDNLSLTKNTE